MDKVRFDTVDFPESMIILWFVAGASLVASLAALIAVRRSAQRLDELSQMYWGLRYQQGELRAQLKAAGGTPTPTQEPAEPSRGPSEAFVPLSSVRR